VPAPQTCRPSAGRQYNSTALDLLSSDPLPTPWFHQYYHPLVCYQPPIPWSSNWSFPFYSSICLVCTQICPCFGYDEWLMLFSHFKHEQFSIYLFCQKKTCCMSWPSCLAWCPLTWQPSAINSIHDWTTRIMLRSTLHSSAYINDWSTRIMSTYISRVGRERTGTCTVLFNFNDVIKKRLRGWFVFDGTSGCANLWEMETSSGWATRNVARYIMHDAT